MEYDHFQESTIAKLQRIQTFGKFKLFYFKGFISKENMAICEAYKSRVPSWYPLIMDVLIKFLYAVSFVKLCTYHFDIMKWIMRFLHLNYCCTETMQCCLRRCLLTLLRNRAWEWEDWIWSLERDEQGNHEVCQVLEQPKVRQDGCHRQPNQ